MKLKNLLLEAKIPKLDPEVYKRITSALMSTMGNVKRKFDSQADRPRIDDDLQDVEVHKVGKGFVANVSGSMRFSRVSKVFSARPGEQDDDFPNVDQKSVKEMQNMLERVLKIQGFKIQKNDNKPPAKGEVQFWVTDSEKFFMDFGVQIGL